MESISASHMCRPGPNDLKAKLKKSCHCVVKKLVQLMLTYVYFATNQEMTMLL